ncbi:hypothetical protein CHUAL_010187 [Chamberlinius hualienensis]
MEVIPINAANIWTQEKTVDLIKAMQLRPAIWDANVEEYKSRRARQKCYEELADIFECSRQDIEKKIANLKSQYSRELKLIRRSSLVGKPYESKWFGFKLMQYISAGKIAHRSEENILMDESLESFDFVEEDGTKKTKSERRDIIYVKEPYQKSTNKVVSPVIKFVRDFKLEKSEEQDQFDIFGACVAAQLRKLPSDYAKSVAKFNIQKALFDAELIHHKVPTADASQSWMTPNSHAD